MRIKEYEEEIIEEEILEEEFPHDIVRTMYEFLGFKNIMNGHYYLISKGWFETFDQYCTDLLEVDIHEASAKDSKQLISILKIQRLLRIVQKTKRLKNAETANFIYGEKHFSETSNNIHAPLKIYDQDVSVSIQGIVNSLNFWSYEKRGFKIMFNEPTVYIFEMDFKNLSVKQKAICSNSSGTSAKDEQKIDFTPDTLFNLVISFVSNHIYVNLNDNQIFRFKRFGEGYDTTDDHPTLVTVETNNILWVRSLTISYPMDLLVQNEDQIENY